TLLVGITSDGDTLGERFTGVNARYQNKRLGTDRLGLRFDVDSYHNQWDSRTLEALAANPNITGEAYRARQNFQPVLSIALARPLTLEVGASFERFDYSVPAAQTETSNAVLTTLRYHRRLADSDLQQDVDAGYALRAATKLLGSDFVFASHTATLH